MREADRLDFVYHDAEVFGTRFTAFKSAVVGGGADFYHGGSEGVKAYSSPWNVDRETDYTDYYGTNTWESIGRGLWPSDHYGVITHYRYNHAPHDEPLSVFQFNILNEGMFVKGGILRIVESVKRALPQGASPAVVTFSEVRNLNHGALGMRGMYSVDDAAGTARANAVYGIGLLGSVFDTLRYVAAKLTEGDPHNKCTSVPLLRSYDDCPSWVGPCGKRDADVGILVRTPKDASTLPQLAIKGGDKTKPIVLTNLDGGDRGSVIRSDLELRTSDGQIHTLTVATAHLNYQGYYLDVLVKHLNELEAAKADPTKFAEVEKIVNDEVVANEEDGGFGKNSRLNQVRNMYDNMVEARETLPENMFIFTGDLNTPSHEDWGRR